MRTRSTPIWLSVTLLSLGACTENDLGSGANTMDREFSKSVQEVWAAATTGVEKLDCKIASDVHDKLGGELVAHRAGGSDIHVWVKSLDERNTRVSVRVEPGDRALATLIQERIAEQVGLGAAKASMFGGNSLTGSYATSLDVAVTSAHRAYSTLEVSTTDEETHATSSRIDGRMRNSNPVRIKIEKEGSLIRVTFTSGNEDTQDNLAFVRRMKHQFEMELGPTAVED